VRYAIFSDIHGNFHALNQMILDLNSEVIDGYICCGDICGYYYDQLYVIHLLKNLDNLLIVKGNHDKFYEDMIHDKELKFSLTKKYGSSYNKEINLEIYNYVKELPHMIEKNIYNRKVGIFHGSPNDFLNGRIYPDNKVFHENFNTYDICFLGHTHYQFYKKVGNTIILNPGSIGQPRDGLGFSYCIFDFDSLEYEYRTVNFNKDELKEIILKNEESENNREYLCKILDRKVTK
jgi:putative phosphoesterase